VRSHRVDQFPAEVVGAQRFQVIGDLVRQRRFDERERFTRMVDHMRIGLGRTQVAGAVGVVEREVALEAVGAHPSVAIPLGAPCLESHTVDHAVTGEPVGTGLTGIRAVAQIPAVQVGGNRALNAQVDFGQFILDRREVAGSEELIGTEQG
jgi:hypothetical protein